MRLDGYRYPLALDGARCPWSQVTAAGVRAASLLGDVDAFGTLTTAPSLAASQAVDVAAVRLAAQTMREVRAESARLDAEIAAMEAAMRGAHG